MEPLISSYSAIMLDEAHERNLNTDLLLGKTGIIFSLTLPVYLFSKFHPRRNNEVSNQETPGAEASDNIGYLGRPKVFSVFQQCACHQNTWADLPCRNHPRQQSSVAA